MTFKYPVPFSSIAIASLLLSPVSGVAQSILLTAQDFALLGGTAITSTGVAGTIISGGDVALSPGATTGITGFPPALVVDGAIVATSGVTAQARLDLIRAQVGLAGMATTTTMSNIDLGGKTLAPGVYTFAGAATQNGALVLDAQGKNNVSWVFQIGTSLTTSINSTVTIINVGSNGGSDYGVFWNAGAEIIFGANNQVLGNYLSGTSITLGAASFGSGRDLALAAITLDNNQLTVGGGLNGSDWDGALKYNSFGDVVSSSSVLISAPGAYSTGASGVVFTPGTEINTSDVTIDGNITNGITPTSLSISSATVRLTGTGNTYTGGTVVDAGTLITSTQSLPVNGAISLPNNGALILNQTSNGSFGGVISGTGTLTKQGPASLTLTGANTYSGGTTLTAGTLALSGAGTLGDTTGVLAINGGTLDLGTTSQTTGAVTLGGGTISNGTLNGTSYSSTGGVVSASLVGTGALTNTSGSTTLSGTNTYTGGTTVNGGTLTVNTTSLPGNVAVASGSSLVFDQPADGAFSGVISGAGSLVKSGNGVLTLTGANTYTGTTTITGGRIAVSGSGTLGGGLVTSSGGTIDAVLSGTGLTTTGGTTTLLRNNTYTGATTISGGTLVLGTATTTASTGTGAVTIASGAFLRGNGTINGNLINGGTVSPGFSPGTITVIGNYQQTNTGTLVIEIAPTASDKLVITGGTAMLAGTLQLDAIDGFNPAGQTIEFLTADGGVSGVFDSITGSAADRATVSREIITSNPNARSVKFTQLAFTSFATTPNQTAIATAAQNSPAITTAINSLTTASQVTAALNAISPQGYQVWSDIAFAHSASLGDRLNRQPGATEGHDDYYFEASQSRGRITGDQNVRSTTYTSESGLVGANHYVSENLTLGGFFEYTESNADLGSAGSETTVKTKMPGIRAAWKQNAWFANGAVAYGFDDYESSRVINFPGTSQTAKSETSGKQWLADVTFGRRFQTGPVTLSPFAGIQANGWRAKSFTETGAGAFNATVANQEADSLRTQLGLEASVAFNVGSILLRPHARGAWIHELSNDSRSIEGTLGGAAYTVRTRNPQVDSARLSAGLDVVLSPTVSLYADYSIQTGNRTRVLGEWRAGLGVSF